MEIFWPSSASNFVESIFPQRHFHKTQASAILSEIHLFNFLQYISLLRSTHLRSKKESLCLTEILVQIIL